MREATDMRAVASFRPAAAIVSTAVSSRRIQSVDVLRGLVIILMILDHVRDFIHASGYAYNPLDPERTTALLFTTRWITHFCAPTFVFIAGVSAWLQHARGKSQRELSFFLLIRGIWLVILEMTVLGFGWSFAFPYLLFLQVIWAIGCSMIVLAALVWLPRNAVLAIGIAIIAGHNLADGLQPPQFGPFADLWTILHSGGPLVRNGQVVALAAYPVLAWIGVMAFGYGMGQTFMAPERQRDRTLVLIGAAMVLAFLLPRFFNLYGDPTPWAATQDFGSSVMSFLRVQKYPPSLMYVCATLGPVLLLIPLIERWHGAGRRSLLMFGSVPLFTYVVHVYLVHALSIGLHAMAGQSLDLQFDTLRKMVLIHGHAINATGLPLPAVYATWLLVIVMLYPLCQWFAGVKARRRDWWLSYL